MQNGIFEYGLKDLLCAMKENSISLLKIPKGWFQN